MYLRLKHLYSTNIVIYDLHRIRNSSKSKYTYRHIIKCLSVFQRYWHKHVASITSRVTVGEEWVS